MRQALSTLAAIASKYDTDGIEIYFLNNKSPQDNQAVERKSNHEERSDGRSLLKKIFSILFKSKTVVKVVEEAVEREYPMKDKRFKVRPQPLRMDNNVLTSHHLSVRKRCGRTVQ